ncbi:DNA-binding protein [Streptomyces sp. NPDC088719]|uniref:DNA-binding protein n=1 Tax=Streptomyces sp. NPDC088719 TaxID=3365872 RepID=UPI003817D26D
MSDDVTYRPGEGPIANVSVSLHSGSIAAVPARVGKRGFSAYIDAAVQRQIERDSLAELTATHEAEHGDLSQTEIADARVLLVDAGLHGHKFAVDSVVASTALHAPKPAVVLTSDPEDLTMLCGDRVRIVKV